MKTKLIILICSIGAALSAAEPSPVAAQSTLTLRQDDIDKAVQAAEQIADKELRKTIQRGLLAGMKSNLDCMESLKQVTKGALLNELKVIAASLGNPAERIKANAQKQWPNDHTQQEFVIKEQTAALKKIEQYKASGIAGVPSDVFKEIVASAEKKWGDDFTMVLYVIEDQAKSYAKVK